MFTDGLHKYNFIFIGGAEIEVEEDDSARRAKTPASLWKRDITLSFEDILVLQ